MRILSDVEIRQITDPIIDAPKSPEVFRAFLQMCELCDESNGIGLAAIQVGLPWRMFITRQPDDSYECFLDCNYEPVGEEKVTSVEGCLSLRTFDGAEFRSFEVTRFSSVRVVGKKLQPDLSTLDIDVVLTGLYSIVCQHEIDHSRLIFISDIGKEIHVYS